MGGSWRALAKGCWQIPHMCLVPLAAPATTAITEPRGAISSIVASRLNKIAKYP